MKWIAYTLWMATLACLAGCDAGSLATATEQTQPARSASPAELPSTPVTGTATIEFLDVGQGDAILVHSPEGKVMLVDAGPSKEIVGQLKERGVRAIDLLVISHHHLDHYGGADDVIRNFPVTYFLATDSSHTTKRYLELLKLAADRQIRPLFPTSEPRRLQLGTVPSPSFRSHPRTARRRTTTRSASEFSLATSMCC